jgi:hypothetical protein
MTTNVGFGKILAVLGICIFAGVVIIGIGIGAVYPPINYVASPLVCPNGTMTNTRERSTASRNRHGEAVSLFCVDDETSVKAEVYVFPTVIYSGLIYGSIIASMSSPA